MAKKSKKNRSAARRAAYQQTAVLPKSRAVNPVVIGIVTVSMVIVLAVGFVAPYLSGSTTASGASGAGVSVNASQQQLITSLESTLKTDPNNLGVLVQLGNTYYDSQQFGQAVERYNQALAINPNDTNVRTDLGTSYYNLGMYSQAIDAFNKALAVDPNKPQTHLNLGNALLSQSNPDLPGAVAEWNKAIQNAGGDQTIVKQAQDLINKNSAR